MGNCSPGGAVRGQRGAEMVLCALRQLFRSTFKIGQDINGESFFQLNY